MPAAGLEMDIDVLFTGSYLPWATERNETLKAVDEKYNLVIHSVNDWPGFKNVRPPMMDDRLDKIRHLKKLTNIPIEADGGINEKTISKAKDAGATRFVSTSSIWNSENPPEKFRELSQLLV